MEESLEQVGLSGVSDKSLQCLRNQGNIRSLYSTMISDDTTDPEISHRQTSLFMRYPDT